MLNERNSVSSFLRSCFEHNQSALGSLKRECCLPREWHRYLGSGMQNPWLKLTLAAVLLTFLGCSKQEEHKPKAPPIKVMAIRAERGDLAKRLHVSGPLKFIANTTVSAEVAAQVKSIEVSDGQAVNQGQVLLTFDDTKIKQTAIHAASTLQKDEAILLFHKTEYEKSLSLYKSGSVSQTAHDLKFSTYQSSLAQVAMDKATLEKAKEDLKKTKVRAPITGRISKRYVERGDWVNEGGKLFQISDYRKIYLEAHISDLDLAKLDVKKVLHEGVDAKVIVDSYPGRVFSGKLSYVEPVANEGRLFEVRIYLDNQEMLLLQGMYGRGWVVYDKMKSVLKIPLAALLDQVRNNERNRVFVVDGQNKAQITKIKIGTSNRNYADVQEGLKEGDLVVTRGKEVLTTGQLGQGTLCCFL